MPGGGYGPQAAGPPPRGPQSRYYTGPVTGGQRFQPDAEGPQRRPMQYGLLGEPSPVQSDSGSPERDRAGGVVIKQRDSAVPERPPSGAIAAIEVDNLEAFARDLRAMRSKAGLDYPEMAEVSHYTMRTLASAAGGLRLPTLPVTVAYVQSCDGDVAEWEERWAKLAKTLKMDAKALPAAGTPTVGAAQEELPGTPLPKMPPPPQDDGAVYVITSAPSREEHW